MIQCRLKRVKPMSGHSKWSTIKHQKEAQDKKRGAIFTKLGRAIAVAVREGGSGDPESNFSLRLAIDRAKAANMPKDNIARAIERGLGRGGNGEELKEVIYEAFGPRQVGILIQVLTDNTNRTISEIKKIVERGGGVIASPGAVSYLFDKKGILRLKASKDTEQMMLDLIDLGAEDVNRVEGKVEVLVAPESLSALKNAIVKAGFIVSEMELAMRPKLPVVIENKGKAQKVTALLEVLDEHDDVQNVWTNFVKK